MLQAWHGYPWPHLEGLTERDIQRYADRQRRVYEAAHACCCTSHWVADSITGSYGFRPSASSPWPRPNHEAPEPAARDWSVPRYLFIGIDWARKNGPVVLEAFAHVRERHPGARLDVVGGHPPIEQDGVMGHGRLSLVRPEDRARIAALYREATTFVMPSLHEPAGIVYLEAAGAGVPSIGTTNGGAATMIGPGGIVVDPLERDAIVEAMLTLADPDTARRLGGGPAPHRHAQLFTWRKVAERLLQRWPFPASTRAGSPTSSDQRAPEAQPARRRRSAPRASRYGPSRNACARSNARATRAAVCSSSCGRGRAPPPPRRRRRGRTAGRAPHRACPR